MYVVKISKPIKYKRVLCNYCFKANKATLAEEPLLGIADIKGFDWNNQQLLLTVQGEQKVNAIKIPLPGVPVVFTIEGEPLYGFWLWNYVSSFGCDRVYTYAQKGFYLKFGLPEGNTKGKDPRFNKKLKSYLSMAGLLIEANN